MMYALLKTLVSYKQVAGLASGKLRYVFRYHIIYFMVLNMLILPYYIYLIISFYIQEKYKISKNQDDSEQLKALTNSKFAKVIYLAWVSRGLALTFFRLLEPDFLSSFCLFFHTLIAKFKKKRSFTKRLDDEFLDDPNIVFLSSTQNNLIVSGILQGINLIMTSDG